MASPASLQTDRLRLRPFTHADADFALELHRNPDLVRFIPQAALDSLDAAHTWIDRIHGFAQAPTGPRDPGRGWWCVTLRDGTPVATVVLKLIPPSGGGEPRDTEIGWRQHADHTGHGYVTEAARAVLDGALAAGLDRVVAVTHPDNHASQGVCERLGMTRRGLTTAYYDETCELFEVDAATRARP